MKENSKDNPAATGVASGAEDSDRADGLIEGKNNLTRDNGTAPNASEAERFLAALDPTAEKWTFQTFDDFKERKDEHLARVLHGTLDEHWATLKRFNERGAGIFVTINETDFKGRSTENIKRVRALFVDLDGAPLPNFGPVPHIVVQTSPGKWHVYWRVYCKNEGFDLKEFSGKQRALIALHGSDRSVCDLPRVMRLPGFLHQKSTPTLVSVLSTNSHNSYPDDTFETLEIAPRRTNAVLTADEYRIARALAFIPNDDSDWKDWCDMGLAIFAATSGSDLGFAIFDAWSRRSGKYSSLYTTKTWDGFERTPPNRIGVGTIIYKATEAHPRWADLLDDGDPHAAAVVAAFMKSVGGGA